MCNKTEVTVGLSISLTGRFRLQGQQALQGIRLWQSYINAQGGIVLRNGERRFVRLIWYDDRSQIGCARENVLRLLREDQINALFGPYSSSLTMAAAEIVAGFEESPLGLAVCTCFAMNTFSTWKKPSWSKPRS